MVWRKAALMQGELQISGETRFVCLLGNPTGHSLSPAMHNLSFKLIGLDAVYTCFDVKNDDLGAIVAAFKAMERWDGFNLTMPCKQAIIPHLDGLDQAAQLIGAVNLVKKVDGQALGFNTDGVGFMANLRNSGVRVKGARMVLLGPGGAGSSILAQAALDGVAHLDVFARAGGASYRKALDLAKRVEAQSNCSVRVHELPGAHDASSCREDDLKDCIQAADILVNASPVGMGEGCVDSPVDASFIKPGMVVADAIYHPRETQLIRDARERGCTVVPGLGMLIEQAAAGEFIWYGVRMPVAEIEKHLF